MSENARINRTRGTKIARRAFPCVPVRWRFLAFHAVSLRSEAWGGPRVGP